MVCGSSPELGELNESKAIEMSYWGYGNWHLIVEIPKKGMMEYRYFVKEGGFTQRREWGKNHSVIISDKDDSCILHDFWQQEPDFPVFYTSAFTDSIFSYDFKKKGTEYKVGHIILKVLAPMIKKNQIVGISGDNEIFGNWNPKKALALNREDFPEWSISLNVNDLHSTSHYKFVIIDKDTDQVVSWEWGEPREIVYPDFSDKQFIVYSGLQFRFQEAPWKGAGVAIPVFSLKTDKSWGCGDFSDLKQFIGWASGVGMQLIQLLPVNDTSLSNTWQDSYPYNAISIFALHPQYIAIQMLPKLNDSKLMARLRKERKRLNELTEIDYEAVMKLKWEYLTEIFDQEGEEVLQSADYKTFFENNKDWLISYAAFSYLKEKLVCSDFNKWGEYSEYNEKKIQKLFNIKNEEYKKVAIHLYVQFLLDRQLSDARNYAHTKSVVLKGDIPIGINRYGVEAWKEPHLFKMDAQVGAPPDDFSVTGQNWGFPGYDWDKIAAEDYTWWKRRFSKMADYFDAYRIDHILGFFRIWEIPSHSVQGLLGQFNPALPLSVDELKSQGFNFDDTMTSALVSSTTIESIFGDLAESVKENYFKKLPDGNYKLKNEFENQRKIRENVKDDSLLEKLYSICNEVLFVRDTTETDKLHPRISAQNTFCYKQLSDSQKYIFDKIYNDFFYYRNITFWKHKAMQKLPILINATRMMVCGEDLGMIPSCVPEVMNELHILSLEIQRMPKTFGVQFEHLNSIPYMSVCTTSTHDMNPVRAWWKENKETTRQFYNQVLWKNGEAPEDCEPDTAAEIVNIHLNSPAMWVILPLQDWLAMDGKIRRDNPLEERINEPSNPRHYWRYRMHLKIEDLAAEQEFNTKVSNMIRKSLRC